MISWISTRVTRTPHGSVATSMLSSSFAESVSRAEKVASSASLPISDRICVRTRFAIACCWLATPYAQSCGSKIV